jgi:hypothetical protein
MRRRVIKNLLTRRSAILWDVTKYSPLEVSEEYNASIFKFEERSKQAANMTDAASNARLILQPCRWRQHVPSKRRWTTRLYSSTLHSHRCDKFKFRILVLILLILKAGYCACRTLLCPFITVMWKYCLLHVPAISYIMCEIVTLSMLLTIYIASNLFPFCSDVWENK